MRQPVRGVEGVRSNQAEVHQSGGGEWDAVDALPGEEGDQGEVNREEWPSWMRGWPQRGRGDEESQAADGAEWDARDELPPDE
jgi:hypothetical protein